MRVLLLFVCVFCRLASVRAYHSSHFLFLFLCVVFLLFQQLPFSVFFLCFRMSLMQLSSSFLTTCPMTPHSCSIPPFPSYRTPINDFHLFGLHSNTQMENRRVAAKFLDVFSCFQMRAQRSNPPHQQRLKVLHGD
ncbi:MAG: hypothetical protein BYD32DRAFT_158107 [Podila humilis]|nr:MAG: hypothetical protein BYD32DRAFT_158107 [Podila humilis]